MRVIALACIGFLVLPSLVAADLNTDFAACRRKITQIGSDPKSVLPSNIASGFSTPSRSITRRTRPRPRNGFGKLRSRGMRAHKPPWEGRAYQFGIGVPQNRQEAIRWFDKAGDQGHDQANYFANHLKKRGNYVGFRNDEEACGGRRHQVAYCTAQHRAGRPYVSKLR